MLTYAQCFLIDSTTEYPTENGEKIAFDRMIVLEDATFSTLKTTWKYGNSGDYVDGEITELYANVYPGVITDMSLSSGKVLLCKG